MRKLIYTLAGAAALASASMASAAAVVTGSTNLDDPTPTVVVNPNNTTINFGQNPVGPGAFTSSFSFTNDVAGLYNFTASSSTPDLTFNGVLTGGGLDQTFDYFSMMNPASLHLDNVMLAADTIYTLTFNGTSPTAGSFTGNVTITAAAVPEPATWAMMLLGFGAVGFVMRRRRQPVLAQIA